MKRRQFFKTVGAGMVALILPTPIATRMRFENNTVTTFYSNGAVERMRINTRGKLGFGVENPNAKLYITGGER